MADLIAALPHVFSGDVFLAMVVSTAAGIILGALPGITAAMSIALLIPFTFLWEPLVGLASMAGLYNGAMFGGSIPAILVGIPGTPAGIATTFDGYPMAQKGWPVFAMRIALVGSCFGGIMSAIVLMAFAPPLARVALTFGPAEYFWLAVFGMTAISSLIFGSALKGLLSASFGMALGLVGLDPITGSDRYTFGNLFLFEGLNIVVFLIAVFGIPQALQLAQEALTTHTAVSLRQRARRASEWMRLLPTFLRSSVIGIIVGIMPGVGGNIAPFISYGEARRQSKRPQEFGSGSAEGIAASETANNADNGSSLIPTLALGVPGNPVTAIMLGGMLVHGLRPGPQLFRDAPDVVYGFIWTFLFTVLLMFPMGWFGTRLFAMVLRVPTVLLAPAIIALSVIGTYSLRTALFDVMLLAGFGLLGYFMGKLEIPLAPAVLGLILGPMAESELRRALLISGGDILPVFTRPISVILIVLVVVTLIAPHVGPWLARQRSSRA